MDGFSAAAGDQDPLKIAAPKQKVPHTLVGLTIGPPIKYRRPAYGQYIYLVTVGKELVLVVSDLHYHSNHGHHASFSHTFDHCAAAAIFPVATNLKQFIVTSV